MTREEEILSQAKLITGLFSFRNGLQTPEDAYVSGANWADANPVNPWHKASEELPKETCKVLVCEDNGRNEAISLQVARYTINGNGEGYFVECHFYNKIEPDYWMEIPKLPKEDWI